MFKNRWVGSNLIQMENKYNPYKNKIWMEVEGRYINRSKFRTFMHATQHLNFLYLKTKLSALVGVLL